MAVAVSYRPVIGTFRWYLTSNTGQKQAKCLAWVWGIGAGICQDINSFGWCSLITRFYDNAGKAWRSFHASHCKNSSYVSIISELHVFVLGDMVIDPLVRFCNGCLNTMRVFSSLTFCTERSAMGDSRLRSGCWRSFWGVSSWILARCWPHGYLNSIMTGYLKWLDGLILRLNDTTIIREMPGWMA